MVTGMMELSMEKVNISKMMVLNIMEIGNLVKSQAMAKYTFKENSNLKETL